MPPGIHANGLTPGFQIENSILEAEKKEQEYAGYAHSCAEAAVEKEWWGKTEDANAFWKEAARLDGVSREYGAKAQFFQELSRNPGLLHVRPGGAPKPITKPDSPLFKTGRTGTITAGQPPNGFGSFHSTRTTKAGNSGTTQPAAAETKTTTTSAGSSMHADRETIQLQIDQTEKEMAAYVRASDGNPDMRVLNYYDRLLDDLYSAMDALPTEAINEEALLQALGGNYYTGRPTIGGAAAQTGLGVLGLDVPADIRDLHYDLTHRESIPRGQLALDALALLPLIGGLKYVDDGVDAVKATKRTADAAKHLDEVIDTVGDVSYNGIKLYSKSELMPAELMDELAASGVKYTRENVLMVTKNSNGDLLKHGKDFKHEDESCYSAEEIQGLMKMFFDSEPIAQGVNKNGPYAVYDYNGKIYRIGWGDNGFIKSFYPIGREE